MSPERVRVAAVGDLHCAKGMAPGTLASVFAQVPERADVLALCGDLTDTGTPEEAKQLVRELALVTVPVVAVLGNHDYESEKADEVKQILTDAGIIVLDVIFSSGNGVAAVDDDWFRHSVATVGFIYPAERHRLPPGVVAELGARLQRELASGADGRACQGTLLSRAQYLGNLTEREAEIWTAGIAADGPLDARQAA